MKISMKKVSMPMMGCCLLFLAGQAFASDIVGNVVNLVVGNTGSDEIVIFVSNQATGATLGCSVQVSDPNFSAYSAMLSEAYDTGRVIEMDCTNNVITYLRDWVGNG